MLLGKVRYAFKSITAEKTREEPHLFPRISCCKWEIASWKWNARMRTNEWIIEKGHVQHVSLLA